MKAAHKSSAKVEWLMKKAPCSFEDAVAYLDAEEWIEGDALRSWRADHGEAAVKMPTEADYIAAIGPCGK